MIESTARRVPGLLKGQIWLSPDFDDDLPEDMARAFRGDEPDNAIPDMSGDDIQPPT